MPRVVGIDPGTLTIEFCGLDNGRVFLDRSFPTREALADPAMVVGVLEAAHREAPLDLVAGPSGYGLPLKAARDLTEDDLRLAFLAPAGESGGIGGLRALVRLLARSPAPVVLTPGVIHLPSVPEHRKVNRIDMGTADKVCVAALAVRDRMTRRPCAATDVSLVLLELGGAFTAALAIDHGRIVDGIGGSSGPLGARAAGALDGEVAYLAGAMSKRDIFAGGAATIAGTADAAPDAIAAPSTGRGRVAWHAYLEQAAKAVAALLVSAPGASEIVLSGRFAHIDGVRDALAARVAAIAADRSVSVLHGFATEAGQAAQGAALIADGLAGGESRPLVDALGLRDASGTLLDHLHVISPADARARLGIGGASESGSGAIFGRA